MTIQAAASQIVYAGDGVTVTFAIPFPFDTAADVGVVLTDTDGTPTRITTGFSITGGNGSTGTLTMDAAPALLEALTIFDDPELTQPADYTSNDSFPADSHEAALDRTVRQVKRLHQRVNRSIRVADGDNSDGDDLLLPLESDRAGMFLAFDANGNPTAASGTSGADDALRTDLAAGNAGLVHSDAIAYPRTAAEIAVSVIPENYAYDPLNPNRYSTSADWALVYASITDPEDTIYAWYRLDHAQHPTRSNTITGYKTYLDHDKSGTVAYRCTVYGALAMEDNGDSVSAGGSNSAFGYAALQHNVESSGNSAFGGFALNSCTGVASSHNNAFGYRSLPSLVNGTQNNAFGFQPLDLLTDGDNNHAFGENTLSHIVKGKGNHGFGFQALYSTVGGNNTHAFGYQALFSQTSGVITAISQAASAVVTISTVSTINPFSAGQPVTFSGVGGMTAINDLVGLVTSIGGSSGAWTITVDINSSGFAAFTSGGHISPAGNTAIGYNCGFNVAMRGGNTIIGYEVCENAEPGYGNTILGYQAGTTINCNTGSGDGAELNTLIGFWSGRQLTSGASNSSFGNRSGENITTGSENVCIGSNAGSGITTADQNAWVGTGNAVNLNGNLNSGLGYNAGVQASAQTYTNTTNLGANSTCTGSNQLQLGGSGTTSYAFGAVQDRSDERDKADIRDTVLGLEFIEKLRPVDFRWDMRADYGWDEERNDWRDKDGSQKRKRFHHGLIAQQVADVCQILGVDFGGYQDHKLSGGQDVLSLGYAELIGPLIKAVQQLSARVKELEERT